MPSRRDRALLAAASTYILLSERKRRYWVRPSLQSKKVYSHTDLLMDLRADDTDPITGEINESGWFKNYTRIFWDDFHLLVKLITPYIQKIDTNYRPAITVEEQLAVTLRFLATGDSYKSLMYSVKISDTTIGRFVLRVCKALIEVLKDEIKVSYFIKH